jgi:predicted ferric reductase
MSEVSQRTVTFKHALAWWAVAIVLCMPVVVWSISVGNPLDYLFQPVPAGQTLYVVAKLAGLLAICMFWAQAILALARRTPALKGFPASSLTLHRRMGLATVVLVIAHAGFFVAAASLRKKELAIDLLLPNFTHGYYSMFVSFGAIGFWMLMMAAFAGWRASYGHRAWKSMHMLWPVAFMLTFAHAYAVGTESRYGVMRYVSLLIAISLMVALLSRLSAVWRLRKAGKASGVCNPRTSVNPS